MDATRWRGWRRILVVLLCALALAACRHTPDEERVRDAIAATAHAAEEADARGVVAALSEDFDGNGGALDRRALANMVRLIAVRGDHVGTTFGPIGIERRGDRLVATFTVSLSSGGRLLPERIGVYRVETAWRQDDGDWRCYSATWKQVI